MNLAARPGAKWLWLTLLVIIADQLSKALISANWALYESVAIAPSLNIILAHNSGAAFSMLSDAPGWQRIFLSAVATVVSAIIAVWMLRLKADEKWLALALALILGGALGNLWDRVQLGYVVDFIDVYYNNWHWPAFNVADSAICVGAAILLYNALFNTQQQNSDLA
ncbi:MAG: lipoprotein signal peptidase [Gammaproteobacteria bacterium]|nr:lipoprotein signal peptidase [Gammaproteobacteria bacterium]